MLRQSFLGVPAPLASPSHHPDVSLPMKPDLVRNIVSSMTQRLREVIDREGGWTHY